MEIVIREIRDGDEWIWPEIDDSFTVDSLLVLSLKENRIGYSIREVPKYEKKYTDKLPDREEEDFSEYIGNLDQVIYLAIVDNQLAGYIQLKRNWNRFALVEDIKVDRTLRKLGIGRQLIERAKQWAQHNGMPGLMLETQNNNVGACNFYERCGFKIGGFDISLYKGIPEHCDDVAIYWYLLFE